jgi:hypothetical protein
LPNWIQVGFRRGIVSSARFAPDGQTIAYSAAFDGDASASSRHGRVHGDAHARLSAGEAAGDLPRRASSRSCAIRSSRRCSTRSARWRGRAGGGRRTRSPRERARADWSPDGSQLAVAREIDGKIRVEYPIGTEAVRVRSARSATFGSRATEPGSRSSSGKTPGCRSWPSALSDGSRGCCPRAGSPRRGSRGRRTAGDLVHAPEAGSGQQPAVLAVTLAAARERSSGARASFACTTSPRRPLLVARWDVQVGLRGPLRREPRARALDDRRQHPLRPVERRPHDPRLRPQFAVLEADGRLSARALGEDTRGARAFAGREVGRGAAHEGAAIPAARSRRSGRRSPPSRPHGMRIRGVVPGRKADSSARVRPERSVSHVRDRDGLGEEDPDRDRADAAADFDEAGPVSPDGTLVAGIGRNGDVWVLPLARAERARRFPSDPAVARSPSAGPGTAGRSSSISRHVPGRTQKLDLATGRAEPWKDLAPEDPAGLSRIGPVQVAIDGRSWAYTYIRVLSNLYVVDGLRGRSGPPAQSGNRANASGSCHGRIRCAL